MTVTGFIAFAQGWGGLYIRANRLQWKLIHKHPGTGIKNRYGIPDCPERVHWEDDFALEVGAPAAYDYGPERTSWMIHHLTDWCRRRRVRAGIEDPDPPAQPGGRHSPHFRRGDRQGHRRRGGHRRHLATGGKPGRRALRDRSGQGTAAVPLIVTPAGAPDGRSQRHERSHRLRYRSGSLDGRLRRERCARIRPCSRSRGRAEGRTLHARVWYAVVGHGRDLKAKRKKAGRVLQNNTSINMLPP